MKARVIAVEIAKKILDRRIELLDGVRSLSALRFDVGVQDDDEDFLSFSSVASEMDNFPGSDQRSMWSIEALQKIDPELKKAQDFYRQEIEKSCTSIIKRF